MIIIYWYISQERQIPISKIIGLVGAGLIVTLLVGSAIMSLSGYKIPLSEIPVQTISGIDDNLCQGEKTIYRDGGYRIRKQVWVHDPDVGDKQEWRETYHPNSDANVHRLTIEEKKAEANRQAVISETGYNSYGSLYETAELSEDKTEKQALEEYEESEKDKKESVRLQRISEANAKSQAVLNKNNEKIKKGFYGHKH
jgi:hypothetical protein